jgi:hypothetical protein
MSQHGIEMQERLVVAEESGAGQEPEPMAAPPELDASGDSNALIQSTAGGPATAEEQRTEAEPPRLSRDEELVDTATKMYRLGYCFLCAQRNVLPIFAPRSFRSRPPDTAVVCERVVGHSCGWCASSTAASPRCRQRWSG